MVENNQIAVIAVVALLLSVIGLGAVAYSYSDSGAQAIRISGKVNTWQIIDNAVTNAKMDDDSVDSPDYVDGSIDNVHLAVPKVNQNVSQTLAYGAFTDNLDKTGYIDFTTDQIPAGAIPLGFKAVVTTGFTGDGSADIEVGVAGDTDRFTADTSTSVFTSSTVEGSNALAVDACDGMNAAQTIRVTVTGGADFTSISAGSMVVTLYWVETE